MRIRFLDTLDEYQIGGVNKTSYGNGVVKNTVIAGRIIAHHGVMCEGVEDITQYKTVKDEDGNLIQVEIIQEVIEETESVSEAK